MTRRRQEKIAVSIGGVVRPRSMSTHGSCRRDRVLVLVGVVLGICRPPVSLAQPSQPFWAGHARDAQHTGVSAVASGPLTRIRWQTRVDARPPYSAAGNLPIHYGSPVITQANTVIVPMKGGSTDSFRVTGLDGTAGTRLWRQRSNYRQPPHDWMLPFSPVLSPTGKLWIPAAGGALNPRTVLDVRSGVRKEYVVFYGFAEYRSNRRTYMTNVFINTPLTAGPDGSVYFGFQVTGPTPLGLQSGIARVADDGSGTWVSAAAASGDATITKVAHAAAPALSNDGATLYVVVNDGDGLGSGAGYLLALDSTTLSTAAARRLKDPVTGLDAVIHDDGTASPTVGPDGDVYQGVLERPFASRHFRGWLLHFDAALQPAGVPGGFGWDDTASIVPASMVTSYQGASPYLLFVKYNDYAQLGGDGVSRLAVLDSNDQMTDPISGNPVMAEVLTVVGPTPDEELLPFWPNAVREWCINAAVVDPSTSSILGNNEDGKLYRWSMASGALAESIVLTTGRGQAYTPTLIGPDGTVYALNDATLFAVGP